MSLEENKKLYVRNILFTFIAFAVYKLLGTFVISYIGNAVVNVFVTEVTLLTCALCLAYVTGKLGVLKFTKKGLGKGIIIGIFVVIIDLSVLSGWLFQYTKGVQAITISGGEIVLFLLAMVMVGIAEELMFRGVMLSSCLDHFGEKSVSSIRKAIIISSCVFGAFHIFNVLVGANLLGSLMQAVNAIVLGILFGAVYVRSGKNIWACIILHGFHDMCSFMQSGMLMGKGLSDAVSSYSTKILPSVVFSLIISLFLIRRKKIELCVQNSDAQ